MLVKYKEIISIEHSKTEYDDLLGDYATIGTGSYGFFSDRVQHNNCWIINYILSPFEEYMIELSCRKAIKIDYKVEI